MDDGAKSETLYERHDDPSQGVNASTIVYRFSTAQRHRRSRRNSQVLNSAEKSWDERVDSIEKFSRSGRDSDEEDANGWVLTSDGSDLVDNQGDILRNEGGVLVTGGGKNPSERLTVKIGLTRAAVSSRLGVPVTSWRL